MIIDKLNVLVTTSQEHKDRRTWTKKECSRENKTLKKTKDTECKTQCWQTMKQRT